MKNVYIQPLNEWISNEKTIKFHFNKILRKIQKRSKNKITNGQVKPMEKSLYLEYLFNNIIDHEIFEKHLIMYQSILVKDNILLSYHVNQDTTYDLKNPDDLTSFTNVRPTGTKSFVIFLKTLFTKRIVVPKKVYHLSDKKNTENILKNGITLSNWNDGNWKEDARLYYPDSVFVVDDYEKWENKMKKGSYDVWEIDTNGLNNKWWEDVNFYKKFGKGSYMTFDKIPVSNISLFNKSNEESINESKNYGDLYHFTMFVFLILILESNMLESSNIDAEGYRRKMGYSKKYKDFISFTRNKEFIRVTQNYLKNGGKSAICINGRKITQNYKLVPFNYHQHKSDPKSKNFEAEESLLLKGQNLNNIKKYINYVIVPSYENFNNEMRNYLIQGSGGDWFYDEIKTIFGEEFSNVIYEDEDEMNRFYTLLVNYIKKTKIPYEIY